MLRGVDEHERIARDRPVELYSDHTLQRNCRQYWRLHPQESVGIFFVRKKNSKIRMILDARRTNQWFCQPPGVALAAAETLSRIEVRVLGGVMARSTKAVRFFEESVAHLATDVGNCFHRIHIGQSLAEWFCLGPVRARDVSMNGRVVSGQLVEDHEWIYLCAGALPIGFIWSLRFGTQRS